MPSQTKMIMVFAVFAIFGIIALASRHEWLIRTGYCFPQARYVSEVELMDGAILKLIQS